MIAGFQRRPFLEAHLLFSVERGVSSMTSGQTAIEALGEGLAIQVSADKDEAVPGWSPVPWPTGRGVQNHVHSLDDDALRVSFHRQDSLHSENVLAFASEEFREPAI